MNNDQIYHLVYKSRKRNTAGSKAPEDVTKICNDLGFHELVLPTFPSQKNNLYKKVWLMTVAVHAWQKIYKKIPDNSVLIYQHPGYGIRLTLKYVSKLQKKKACHLVALIHDLESLRKGIIGILANNNRRSEIGDNTLLKRFDAVICHNDSMKKYMVEQGFDPQKLVSLEIFDYLTDAEPLSHVRKKEEPSVVIAGNLAEGKSAYIYKMTEDTHNKNLKIHLFGVNYNEDRKRPNTYYHGSFPPEELVGELDADFGLVWDGPEAETCTGNTGEYLKYNNPHKTSLYLAAGIPVIVWKQAAIAKFIEINNVGIAVDSLYEIENSIQEMDEQEYKNMRMNAKCISAQIREGNYCKMAIKKALAITKQ